MSIERQQYETGWGRCADCGCRRPLKQLTDASSIKLALGRERYKSDCHGVCTDARYCESVQQSNVPNRKVRLCKQCNDPVVSGGGRGRDVHEACKPQRYKERRALRG